MDKLLDALRKHSEEQIAILRQKEQKYDQATIDWFEARPGEDAWMTLCSGCDHWYITKLGHTCKKEKE